VSQPAQRPATYEDLLALPEHVVGEIIHGELVVSPRPAPLHAVASSALGGGLNPPFQFGDGGPGGWWILFEPELHLGEHVLVPDLAGWRRERMPEMPKEAFFNVAPDWVCEVISPSNARIDRGAKSLIYAKHDVSHLWFVDPAARTVEVQRNEGGRWVVVGAHGGTDRVRLEPFEAVELKLGRLWGLTE
jgi:Uma2 family endonuclease